MMLSRARETDCTILWVLQDIRSFDIGRTAQIFVSTTDTVNHLTEPDDVRKLFARIGECLEPGGVFIFDAGTKDHFEKTLGDNIFYSAGLTEMLNTARNWASSEGRRITRDLRVPKMATIFGIGVRDPQRYGIAEVDEFGNVISIEEKPENPKSNICVTGLYFYPGDVLDKAKQVKPSARGELEITTLNQMYLKENRLRLEHLPRAAVWLDTGTFESLFEASSFVETIEKRSGAMVCCPEEIAFSKGWITPEKLLFEAKKLEKNEYGQYLKELYFEKIKKD
jgi:glucose-1-phosphate thymidylyltransferase